MGIFSNRKKKLKEKLEKKFVQFLADYLNVDQLDAKKMADNILDGLIEESEIEFHEGISPYFGDTLLSGEKTDASIRTMLGRKRIESVNDNDIRWLWNMPADERLMLIITDNFFKSYSYTQYRTQGFTEQEAKCKLYKRFPYYGELDSDATLSGDDRPLPWELKDRINTYGIKRGKTDYEQYEKDMDASSSFNALVRKEIKEGKI